MTRKDFEPGEGAQRMNAAPPPLAQIGEALYGPRWQTELARALGVSDRTIRYWLAGTPIPARVYGDLLAICCERRCGLSQVIADLTAANAD